MAEQITGKLEYRVVETEEAAFKPGAKAVEVVMKPKAGEEIYWPPAAPFEPLPPAPPKRSAVINIETTGLMPFDSRIINIAVIDLREPESVVHFFDADESKLVTEFIKWFDASGINELIGFNISFDYRFIFAKMLRYRIVSTQFIDADLYDIMQILKQVKAEFVFGFNKPGTLNEWADYLLDMRPPISQAEVLKAWEEERYKDIEQYNKWKVEATSLLYVLIKYISGEISA